MRVVMSLLDRFFIWGIDQAESRGACLVEPIREEAHAILALVAKSFSCALTRVW